MCAAAGLSSAPLPPRPRTTPRPGLLEGLPGRGSNLHLSGDDGKGTWTVARENWTYIRVDVLMASNPKVAGLSPASKWLLIGFWCYCAQHLTDGFVPDAIWRRQGRARERQPLIDAGLAEPVPGGYNMHDYLEHQRSRAEVEALSAKRREAGSRGGQAKANALAKAKQVLERLPASKSSKTVAEAEAEAEQTHTTADVITPSVEVPPDAAPNGRYDLLPACPQCGVILDRDRTCFICGTDWTVHAAR